MTTRALYPSSNNQVKRPESESLDQSRLKMNLLMFSIAVDPYPKLKVLKGPSFSEDFVFIRNQMKFKKVDFIANKQI